MNSLTVVYISLISCAIFISAVLVRECRDIKNTHDAVIRMEAKQK